MWFIIEKMDKYQILTQIMLNLQDTSKSKILSNNTINETIASWSLVTRVKLHELCMHMMNKHKLHIS